MDLDGRSTPHWFVGAGCVASWRIPTQHIEGDCLASRAYSSHCTAERHLSGKSVQRDDSKIEAEDWQVSERLLQRMKGAFMTWEHIMCTEL